MNDYNSAQVQYRDGCVARIKRQMEISKNCSLTLSLTLCFISMFLASFDRRHSPLLSRSMPCYCRCCCCSCVSAVMLLLHRFSTSISYHAYVMCCIRMAGMNHGYCFVWTHEPWASGWTHEPWASRWTYEPWALLWTHELWAYHWPTCEHLNVWTLEPSPQMWTHTHNLQILFLVQLLYFPYA